MEKGVFCVSLDFELFWGVRDHRSIQSYGQHLRNVHVLVPRLLELFKQYDIHCTWATVGMLFCEDKKTLLKYLPSQKPSYDHCEYDPYEYLLNNELEPIYHFAPALIDLIKSYKGQEIATHTFSHYYCLEKGQTLEQFEADLQAAIAVASEKQLPLRSLVFPRNQFNQRYLEVCKKYTITAYRGNENSWLYQARNREKEKIIRRCLRLIDAYINLSGHHTYSIEKLKSNAPVNIPATRFLRPYSKTLSKLDGLRLHRICSGIDYAAKQGKLYHLWWHPHNFGSNMEHNFFFLEKIFRHIAQLRRQYGLYSLNMNEIVAHYNLMKEVE